MLEQLKWLKRVVQGHMNYFSVLGNSRRINAFRTAVQKIWYKTLKRRSLRSRLNWKKFGAFVNAALPKVKVLHPWPEKRFDVNTRSRSRMRSASTDLRRGVG